MDTFIYKLRFKSPLQVFSDPLSMGKPDVVIHSDTLFSAVVNSIVSLFGSASEDLFISPPFVTSSAFAYSGDVLFFPRPRISINGLNQALAKRMKKTEFVSEEILRALIANNKIELSDNNFYPGGFLSSRNVNIPVLKVQELPRCRIGRISSESEIFYSQRVVFSPDAGLFFLARFSNEKFKSEVFDPAFSYLSDTGIGGDRSIGNGRFEFSCSKFDLPEVNEDKKYFMNLSLYCPTKDEIERGILESARYAMKKRQNWIYSNGPQPIRSKSVMMFMEGSIFSNVPNSKGKIVNTTPEVAGKYIDHPVYRSGVLFGVPVSEVHMEA